MLPLLFDRLRWMRSRSTAAILARVALQSVGIGVAGLCFTRPHRLVPRSIQVGSLGFCMSTALYFGGGVLRDALLGTASVEVSLSAQGLTYLVLLLASVGTCLPEMTLCLCILGSPTSSAAPCG